MKKFIACLSCLLVVVMLLASCGPAADPSDVESTLGGKDDVAIKGDAANKNNNTSTDKPSGDFNAEVEIKDVVTKEYTVKAKGSKYADGIMLPKLSKKEATISFMTNNTWQQLIQESTETSPTAYYHAMLIWKETYGVDVEIELVDWGNFTNHLVTSVVAGDSPEICRWVDGIPRWVNNGLVTSLEDKVNLKDPDFDLDYMKQNCSMYGHIYAAFSTPLQMPVQVCAYNKTKFADAGETDPMTLYKQGKWTFTQFTKTASRMTDAANDEYGLAGTGQLFANNFLLMYLNDDGTVKLRTKEPEFVKSMQAVWNLYRVENAARRRDDCRDTFPLGKDAMALTNMRDYARMMDTAKANGTTDEFGVVPYPTYDFIGKKTPFGSDSTYLQGMCISSNPQNMDGAVEFLRLVTKVGANISKKLGKWAWVKDYMSAEEKAVFDKVEFWNWGKGDCTLNLSGSDDHLDNYLKYPICLSTNVTQDLSTILANAHSGFEGVISEYEINAGLRK